MLQSLNPGPLRSRTSASEFAWVHAILLYKKMDLAAVVAELYGADGRLTICAFLSNRFRVLIYPAQIPLGGKHGI